MSTDSITNALKFYKPFFPSMEIVSDGKNVRLSVGDSLQGFVVDRVASAVTSALSAQHAKDATLKRRIVLHGSVNEIFCKVTLIVVVLGGKIAPGSKPNINVQYLS